VTIESALTGMIGAIGEEGFIAATAESLRMAIGFDLAAAILHRADAHAELLVRRLRARRLWSGPRQLCAAIRTGMSPMVHPAPMLGAMRARDFVLDGGARTDTYLVWTDEEEMGFRTLGWPERCEEIGLYVAAWGGVVELSFYRERARTSLSASDFPGAWRTVRARSPPPSTATGRLRCPAPARERLSTRECEVYDLMVAGCSSEAIALRLAISRHTVKDHRKQIFRKLQVGSLAELFARSRRSN
jgi:DNA-binding CsgD family transcriptional regulator